MQLCWSRPGAKLERGRGHRHEGGGEGDTEDVATATGLVGSFDSPQSTESHEATQQQLRHLRCAVRIASQLIISYE